MFYTFDGSQSRKIRHISLWGRVIIYLHTIRHCNLVANFRSRGNLLLTGGCAYLEVLEKRFKLH